jgi:hypothetical protein
MEAYMYPVNTLKTIVLAVSLLALAVPAQAAPRTQARDHGPSLEQTCRDKVGGEEREGEGRGHIGQLQVQRFSECMMGRPY